MGKILPFSSSVHSKKIEKEINDLSDFLRHAVLLRRKSFGLEENGIFRLSAGLKDMFSARINAVLLENKRIDTSTFNCALYVSELLAEAFMQVPDSYWAVDYFRRAEEENRPELLRRGADMCCMICILFEARSRWRSMRENDFSQKGMQLYLAFYGVTQKPIGWHMAKNFDPIVVLAKKCLKDI